MLLVCVVLVVAFDTRARFVIRLVRFFLAEEFATVDRHAELKTIADCAYTMFMAKM